MGSLVVSGPHAVLTEDGYAGTRAPDAGSRERERVEVSAAVGSAAQSSDATVPHRSGDGRTSPPVRGKRSHLSDVAESAEFHRGTVALFSRRRGNIHGVVYDTDLGDP